MQKKSILPLVVNSPLASLTGCNKEPILDSECSYKQSGSGVTDIKKFKNRMISNDEKYFIYESDDNGYKFKLEIDRQILSATMIMKENNTTNVKSYLTGVCK
ncbi:TPA: hypothetical protein I8627_004890 [Citrobacter freundii]|uniref:hypothetical protein n=1 Tax=Citrobacter freundii complex TaxID=1344959 RepID=UPI000642F8BD|nr:MULTISPECIES: hypothetical protein [Citrobacter]MDU3904240.1 hypothetical protein [Citrobacter portucalensis]EJB5573759.1 hypothetical protein [Citrobacter freundii]EKV4377463.1 hypothetical protein [Citrobacter freundii]ELJ9993883.1 hypothetical protein [Citrobacter freundii]ELO0986900.1 hypothetical protein [Citrobacter freundii]